MIKTLDIVVATLAFVAMIALFMTGNFEASSWAFVTLLGYTRLAIND